ncbi:MAG TPA: hypothetical protein VF288_09350 [Mycobacteriales bacterium]
MTATGPTGAAGAEPTLVQLAEQAAEAIRALNHLTRPGVVGPSSPAETAGIVATLAATTARLPQLIGQLSSRLVTEQQHGRLRLDALSAAPDPATAVAAATSSLARAATYAARAGHDLDAAHQRLAHLAVARDETARRVGRHPRPTRAR